MRQLMTLTTYPAGVLTPATSEMTGCPAAEKQPEIVITGPLTLLFSIAVGVIVTNLFAPQTLVGLIGPSLGFSAAASGFVAMVTFLGYAGGLFLLVPLADLVENRRLVLCMLACAIMAAAGATLIPTAAFLLAVLFILGAACSAIQILVPLAATMAPPDRLGRVIGDVMGGLMIGILLSRPLASFIAEVSSWRAFYGLSALVMGLLMAVLARRLPQRRPEARSSYPALIASLWHLLRSEPVLRRRSLTASLAMAAFSLFWTAVALRLAQAPFHLDHRVPSHHHRGVRACGLGSFIPAWGVALITWPHGVKCCPSRCRSYRRSDARPSRDQSSPAGGTRSHYSLRRSVLPWRSGWRRDGRHHVGVGRMADDLCHRRWLWHRSVGR